MLNRRHIRIKVMQSVYAFLQSKNDDVIKEEKFLFNNIDKLYDLFILQVSLCTYVQKLAKKRVQIVKDSKIKNFDYLQAFTNLANNKFINIIAESDSLNNYISDNKLEIWSDATEYIQIIIEALKEDSIFKNYNKLTAPSFNEDKAFAIAMLKHIIAPNDKLASFYEDQFIGWVDDIPFINTVIVKTYNKLNKESVLVLQDLYKDDEDRIFAKKLFQKVVLLHTDYDTDIDKKTPNWDYERIAGIDKILMKMAITEFLHFPSIPTKVTINEYLEIA
ncbi:MAG: transcription antitermination factor NusB, partial [Flavobacteriaceae bacterium]